LSSIPRRAEADFAIECPLGERRVGSRGRGEKGPVDGTYEGGLGHRRRGEKGTTDATSTRFGNCACLIYLCLQSITFYWVVEIFGGMSIPGHLGRAKWASPKHGKIGPARRLTGRAGLRPAPGHARASPQAHRARHGTTR
jgi:hypothetical protein